MLIWLITSDPSSQPGSQHQKLLLFLQHLTSYVSGTWQETLNNKYVFWINELIQHTAYPNWAFLFLICPPSSPSPLTLLPLLFLLLSITQWWKPWNFGKKINVYLKSWYTKSLGEWWETKENKCQGGDERCQGKEGGQRNQTQRHLSNRSCQLSPPAWWIQDL